ncbi:sensor histidine kinase [Devriesea agamarum]|uniref:sensor histidine kinase n=1 Tax=Devriesea agamarum TaxID=472569 RepID=UPI00071C4879|nr:histidine kinase [Devriesea agamarum]
MWLALVPLIGALWMTRPRLVRIGHGIALTAVTVVLATPVAVFGTLGFTIPVLLLVVAFAVIDVSPKAGVYATIWISGAGFALHMCDGLGSWQAFRHAVMQALINVVPFAVMLCFGIALGLALRRYEQRRATDQKVIDRLRHAAEIEKELLLSDERARSARELHDGLGHRLTLVSMSLELAERMRASDTDQAWQEIRTAKDTSSEALAEMRTWVRALNPVRDANARGLSALELIAESFRGTGVTVEVLGDDASNHELTHNDATALLIYRAVQEGLTNALRHSRARSVRITLETNGHLLHLAISNRLDRAVTVKMNEDPPQLGFGLRGLSDRATKHGGSMRARRQGNEFTLEVFVPIGEASLRSKDATR